MSGASGSGGARYQPPSRRPGAGDVKADGMIAVRSPLKATNVPVQYLMLTEMNYNLWAVKMKIIMRLFGV
jgi:hypothetical protein